jgi:electron transfer flavoprotein alpha subunit
MTGEGTMIGSERSDSVPDTSKNIWVLLEQVEGVMEPVSWELLGKGKELAGRSGDALVGILFGDGVRDLAEEAIERGADRVLLADDPLLAEYSWEAYSKVVAELVDARNPSILLIGATHNGRELAGRLAVRLHTGLTADVVRLDLDDRGMLISAVPGFGGSILAMIKCEQSRPQMSTVRPGIFTCPEPDPSKKGEIENVQVTLDSKLIRSKLVERNREEGEDISKADRIVAAGRGAAGDIHMVEELADILDAGVGVTRPLADVRIRSRDYQIGSTGVTVRPELTVVCGASGAIHFISGIQESGTIISINTDEHAQIFEHSDYCVVGDTGTILEALILELRSRERNPKRGQTTTGNQGGGN